MLGLGKLAHLRVLRLEGNRNLDVLAVVDSLCCKAPLFGVPLLMGWDALRPVSTLQQVSLDIQGAEARVRQALSLPCCPCGPVPLFFSSTSIFVQGGHLCPLGSFSLVSMVASCLQLHGGGMQCGRNAGRGGGGALVPNPCTTAAA